jgi:hypothetical protein
LNFRSSGVEALARDLVEQVHETRVGPEPDPIAGPELMPFAEYRDNVSHFGTNVFNFLPPLPGTLNQKTSALLPAGVMKLGANASSFWQRTVSRRSEAKPR